ncbi:MAG: histidinol-phosphatase HisJ family protein [bacterium]
MSATSTLIGPALPDYHTHSRLCHHAEGTLAEYRAVAARRGLPALAVTDHTPNPVGYDSENRMGLSDYPCYQEMLRQLQDGHAPEVLCGIEADYHEGCEAYLPAWLSQQPFDVVLGSVHHIHDWGFDNPERRGDWARVDVQVVWREYFALVTRMAATGWFNIVGHLDLPKKFGHRLRDDLLREIAAPALDAVARAGMAIEINTSGLRKPVAEMYPSPLLLGMAYERGIAISFGSDAHRPEDVGADFGKALALARAAGYAEHATYRARRCTRMPLPAAI